MELEDGITPDMEEDIAAGRVAAPSRSSRSRTVGHRGEVAAALQTRARRTTGESLTSSFGEDEGVQRQSSTPRLRRDGKMAKEHALRRQLSSHFFICHTKSGRHMAEAIRRILDGEGFKVVRDTHHDTVDVVKSANVLLLLTKGAARDEKCQRELLSALDIDKPIICMQEETAERDDPCFFDQEAELKGVPDEIKAVVSELIRSG